MSNEYFKAMKNVERLSEESAEQLAEINRVNKINTVANVAAAVNSSRQVAMQAEQLELERQRAEAERHYQLSMWRQTADGRAYFQWKADAERLLHVFQVRQEMWVSAWSMEVERARQAVPPEEVKRFKSRAGQLRQIPLLVAALLALLIAFISVWISVYAFTEVSSNNGWGEGTIADVILFVILFTLPTMFFVALVVFLVAYRRSRVRRFKADTRFDDERARRYAHWGFDPLAVSEDYVGFTWFEDERVHEYLGSIHNLILAEDTLPEPSRLIALRLPKSKEGNSVVAPGQIIDLMQRFQEDPRAAKRSELPAQDSTNLVSDE
ncbi:MULTISPECIES: hypothetical protein [unclassified Brevibacterium]|uniref:hypothetical protein n=1 Tax=unclassified Brevibacterium TaxID=2614124 RepID=UPI0010FA3441|nr:MULTISPECIES: hypothetical protein [unclassified Brevibacterium]MCM1013540.1 hypothetical protein [Brevibacterium sp. XM4083]